MDALRPRLTVPQTSALGTASSTVAANAVGGYRGYVNLTHVHHGGKELACPMRTGELVMSRNLLTLLTMLVNGFVPFCMMESIDLEVGHGGTLHGHSPVSAGRATMLWPHTTSAVPAVARQAIVVRDD